MLKGKTITLVIPCKNEEKALTSLLRKVPSCIDEVIIVDNNSSDATKLVAKSLGAQVITEKRQINGIGYGFAHQKGIKAASGDIIVTADGDGTYPFSEIKKAVLFMLKNELQFVSCNRFPLKTSDAVSSIRKLGVWILNTQVRVLYGYPIKDILSGMWIIDQSIVNLLQMKEGGWDLSPEIKLAAITQPNIAFDEFHINHHYRQGDSKQQIWQTGFGHLVFIAKWKLIRVWNELITSTGISRVWGMLQTELFEPAI